MLTDSQKRYLLAIYVLGQNGCSIISTSVANFLGVTKSSTVKMTQRLIEEGYIIKEPYREIEITQKGIREANELYTPCVILKDFLMNSVGVDEQSANNDSISIAAQVKIETLDKLVEYCLQIK